MRKPQILAIKGAIALAFLAALIIWASGHVSWADITNALSSIDSTHLITALGLILLSHLLRVLRVYCAYKADAPILFSTVAGVSLVHNTVSFLLPMRLGEAALPILSKTKLNVSIAYSSTALLLMRLFDVHWLLMLLLIFASGTYFEAASDILLICALASIPCVLFILRGIVLGNKRFLAVRALVSKPQTLIMLYLLTGLNWVIKLAALAFIAMSIGSMPIAHAWMATIIADASALSPITGFANAGTFEAAFSLPLVPLGYSTGLLLTTALSLHLLIFITNVAAGAVGTFVLLFTQKNQVQ